jgi:hypothetical protein
MIREVTSILKISPAITYYNKFIVSIIKPHFAKYYDAENYSLFIQEHVLKLTQELFSADVKDSDIILGLYALQKVKYFNKQNVSDLFATLIANPRVESTITFKEESDHKLVNLLSECMELGVMMSEILRFILVNKINVCNCNSLYTRHLLYKKMGEITLSGYIYVCMPRPSVEMVVRGLKESDMSNPDFVLDRLYLDYERQIGMNVV